MYVCMYINPILFYKFLWPFKGLSGFLSKPRFRIHNFWVMGCFLISFEKDRYKAHFICFHFIGT